MRFGIDADGNYGYYKVGADTLSPFSNFDYYVKYGTWGASKTLTIRGLTKKPDFFIMSLSTLERLKCPDTYIYKKSDNVIKRFNYGNKVQTYTDTSFNITDTEITLNFSYTNAEVYYQIVLL